MITPGLSHLPQFLLGVGFGSVFLYTILTGYEKGLNVLSLDVLMNTSKEGHHLNSHLRTILCSF